MLITELILLRGYLLQSKYYSANHTKPNPDVNGITQQNVVKIKTFEDQKSTETELH